MDASQILAKLRSDIETRVREQVERHAKVDPTLDRAKVVDLQIDQERERLEAKLDEFEDNPAQYNAVIGLLDWLPELAQQIKRR